MGAKAQAVPAKDAMIQAVVTFMMLLVLYTVMSSAACLTLCWLAMKNTTNLKNTYFCVLSMSD
eukprot:scaffold2055_cov224-Chaetoceros_neogracile.AAC.7